MLRRTDSAGGSTPDSGGRLLKELEALWKALHRNGSSNTVSQSVSAGKSHPKPPPRPEANAKASGEEENPSVGPTEKKSLWSWKHLPALSHVRHRRFICSFSLHVHSIEGLSHSFNGKSLCVNWKMKDGGLMTTKPSKSVHGVSNFDETLAEKCCVYGSVSGANKIAKYQAKQSVLYATMVGTPDHDLGKHKIDLTRLLPDTFEELGEEKRRGNWRTNFKLSGKAKGAILIVTFEFSVLGDEFNQSAVEATIRKKDVGVSKLPNSTIFPITMPSSLEKPKIALKNDMGSSLLRSRSTPTSSLPSKYPSPSVEEVVNIIHEIPPSVKTNFSVYEATGAEEPENKNVEHSRVDFVNGHYGCELEENEFPLIENGTEISSFSADIDLNPVGKDFLSSSLCHVALSDTNLMTVGENLRASSPFHSTYTGLIAVGEDLMTSNDPPRKNKQLDLVQAKNLQLDAVELIPGGVDGEEDLQADQEISEGVLYFEVSHDNTMENYPISKPKIEVGAPLLEASLENRESEKYSGVELKSVDSKTFGMESCYAEIDVPIVELQEQENLKHDYERKDGDLCTDESVIGMDLSADELIIDMDLITDELAMEELDTTFGKVASSNVDTFNTLQKESLFCKTPPKFCGDPCKNKISKSNSLDHLTKSVANEFLTMLGLEQSPFSVSSESDPESPRERLWKQFEKDSMTTGGLFGADIWNEEDKSEPKGSPFSKFHVGTRTNPELGEEFELGSIVHDAEAEHEKAVQAVRSKTRAKLLENLETEVLMQKWGMNERAFQSSSPGNSDRFRSPDDVPPEEPLALPSLGEALGSLVKTRDGGFVRSMSPTLFKNAKNCGSLVIQVSSPVVVPAEMGSGVMDILQSLASLGIEKLTMQAKKLMPLEDIAGKSMTQVTREATPDLDGYESQNLLLHQTTVSGNEPLVDSSFQENKHTGRMKGSNKNVPFSDSSTEDSLSGCVSLEDLAPFAMDKIEALSIEGLKIQSGMSNDEMLLNVKAQSIGEVSALKGTRAMTTGSLGLEGTGGLQLLDLDETNDPIDGLMALSITLDEWIKLDAGIVDGEEVSSDRTSKVLVAHHAKRTGLVRSKTAEQGSSRNSWKRWGFLGNTLTVALLVQLCNPLRNYEPVGTPMLALIRAERVIVPPKPKVYASVSVKGNNEEVEEPDPLPQEIEKKEEVIPQFKIIEIHVSGFKAEVQKKGWGSAKQEQSGSRWLLASGMGKSKKNHFMKSKPMIKSQTQQQITTVKPGETLWSISSRLHGTGAKWKESAALNPHIRNPNIIFPNETFRLS